MELLCGHERAAVAHIPLDLGGQDAGQVAAAAHHAELGLRRTEERALYRDGDVRPGGIAQSAAQAVAVHRADQGHPQVVQRLGAVVIDLLGIGHVLVQDALVEALDVNADAEGLQVGMHHADPDVIVMVDVVAQQQDLLLDGAAGRVDRGVV